MENKKSKIFNLLLLDESGSMSSIHDQTISAFNEIIQTMQNLEKDLQGQAQFVSLHTFNNQAVKKILDLESVGSAQLLDNKTYAPNGSTPLLDALGTGISLLEKQINAVAQVEGPAFNYQVLVTVLTDGYENSSSHYTKQAIRSMIDRLQEGNWTFTYIGADHDVLSQSSDMGIKHSYAFSKDGKGMEALLKMEKESRVNFNRSIFNTSSKPTADFFDEKGKTNDESSNSTKDADKSFIKRILGR